APPASLGHYDSCQRLIAKHLHRRGDHMLTFQVKSMHQPEDLLSLSSKPLYDRQKSNLYPD
ncbi:MAG TPA: hypothetical protein VI728_05605, partial [Syntrophales bacterium]|nr:hypothetical protein [Syntrophales bacterium]